MDKVARFYERQDFVVRKEFRDVDVYVDKGDETVAVEVESLSGSKDYVHAVSNILKASRLADRVEVVVKDSARMQKLLDAVRESPARSYRGLKIRLSREFRKI